MNKNRQPNHMVAVTGIGMICPLGTTTAECWENMLAGKSGVRKITRFDTSECKTRIAGQLPEKYFEFEKHQLPKSVYRRSIFPSRLSMLSARQAIVDAGIDLESLDRQNAAVITGCGGSTFGDPIVYADPSRNKFKFSHEMLNALSACVSIDLGFKGPSFNVATACASGASAIALAGTHVVHSGSVSIALGIDTMIYKETIDGFNQLMALSEANDFPEKSSKPFDKKRSGFVLAEGACAVLLEPYEAAMARGADIYALFTGTGMTSEAYNILAPEPNGIEMARTMAAAIRDAGIDKEKVRYISAHGTATPHNDLAETNAVKHLFGPVAYKLAISAQKSMIGHGIGAAGAIEFAVTALTLKHQIITPTINYEIPDPNCDLDYVPNEARCAQNLEAALTNSFGFGGHNCCLVLEHVDAV